MPAIHIKDLPACRSLDRKAMSFVRGGGAPWVFGWIRPFVAETPSFGPVVNFFQINNFFADQMNNQFQVVDIRNSAPGSTISVALAENAENVKKS